MEINKRNFSFIEVLKFAAHYWFKQPLKLSIIIFLLTSAAFFETYLPSALSNFLEAIHQHTPQSVISIKLIIFLTIYLTQALLFAITYFIYNFFETHIFTFLMNDAFSYVYQLSEHFFVNTFTGSIISKINRGRQKIEVFEDQVLLRIFPTFVILASSTIFLMLHFPLLAILMILYLSILITTSAFLVLKVSGPAQADYANAQDGLNAHLADCISGITTTKSYAQEKIEISHFSNITNQLRRKNFRAYILGNLATLIQQILLVGMLSILLGGGTWYLFHGKATMGDMAYLVLAYTIMQSYIRELGENVKNIITASYDLHAIMALLQEPPETPRYLKTLATLNIHHGNIHFDNVTFTYPEKTTPIFKNFSIAIRKGERIALVGHSGSGKTSFVRLLQCLYPIQAGNILIDEQNIFLGSRLSLRSAIALVPQDPILFHRTLRENIAYGKQTATFAEIKLAAKQAYIDDFISTLPKGYETLVGERGIKLSGGERQRVAIARAILANRPILILDEATSSLDSESERAIQHALGSLTHGRTSIIIAHRLSTILDADRILVFDHGSIVEEGKHEDLILKKNGIYAKFFRLQTSDPFLTFE